MIVQGPDGKRIEFPDGTPPETIKAVMAKQYGGAAPGVQPMGTNTQPNQTNPEFQRRVLEGLPTAGGYIGGLVGKLGGYPGAVAGAGAGGALGEGVRQVAAGEGLSGPEMGKRGLEQAAYEAAGGALAKGASAVARPIMRRALSVGKAIGGKTKIGGSMFPDPVETTLREKIQVSPKGALKASSLRQESARELKKLLATAKLGGKTFKTSDVTRHVKELLKDPVLPSKEKEKILSDLVAFYKDKGLRMDPEIVQGVKRYYQRQARGIYRSGQEGAFTLGDQPHGQFAEKVAQGAREQLESIPGVEARNLRTKGLIGAEKAVERAVQRPAAPFELFRPGTYPMLSRLAGSDVLSHTAILLGDRKFQELARQSPRAAAQLIQQMLLSAESDATAVGQ